MDWTFEHIRVSYLLFISLFYLALTSVFLSGNIIVFLPNDFFGAIQLQTRKGTLHFLPALASVMRTMKDIGGEALVLVGQPTINREVDFLQLSARHGKIVIGLTGLDQYQPSGSFWRKLVGGK